MVLSVGDTIPEGEFGYVPYLEELENNPGACGLPSKVKTSQWAGKKIVLVGVPGAFTPTCSEKHIPPFITSFANLASKGVDKVYVVATNDLFVQSAWGRVLGGKDKVVTISDSTLTCLNRAGLGGGERSKRFALIIDDLKVTYIGVETAPGVGPSGYDAVLAHL